MKNWSWSFIGILALVAVHCSSGNIGGSQCPDETCQDSESCDSCPQDCGECPDVCGDDVCQADEDCLSCSEDCGDCPEDCGNHSCDTDEDCHNCPEDCGDCPAECGDTTCDPDESCENCPQDCGDCPETCGDLTCDADEDCHNCPDDCGDCPPECGDDLCDPGEDCDSCAGDCGSCPSYCGDCQCDPLEDCYNCEMDCGFCVSSCGDGKCMPKEDCDLCPADCGSCLPEVGAHPRIFFSRESIESWRDMAQTTHQHIYEPIQQFVEGELDATEALEVPDPCNQLSPYRLAGNELIAFAHTAVISGDAQIIQKTKDRMLTYARDWPHWGEEGTCDGRDLGHHHMLYGNLLAFDWLYDELNIDERSDVVSSLAQRARESYEASTDTCGDCRNWWRDSYLQNHSSTNHSALGMAALVLQGHVDDQEAAEWLRQAMSKILRVIHIQNGIRDGSWHEGIPYQAYGQTMLLPFLKAYREASSVGLFSEEYLKNLIVWKVANTRPGTWQHIHTFGNFDWSWGNSYSPTNIYRAIASEFPETPEAGLAEWLAQYIDATDGRHASRYRSPWYVYEFFYYDPLIEPTHPQDVLPVDLHFKDIGAVVWRTGWHAGELIFGLKAGRQGGSYGMSRHDNDLYPFELRGSDVNLGHDHQDAGNFFLYLGDSALTHEKISYDAGATGLHNSILIDGQPQYQLPSDGMTNYGDGFTDSTVPRLDPVIMFQQHSYLAADLTNVYRETLADNRPGDTLVDKLERHVLFARPDYLVMLDNIESSQPHRVDWVAHFPGPVTEDGDWLRGTGEDDGLLGVRVLSPAPFATSFGNDGLDYVRVGNSATVDNLRIITVLYPTRDWNSRPAVDLLADSGEYAGVRVALDGTRDHLFNYGDSPLATIDEYVLVGRVASVVRDSNDALTGLFLGQGQELSDSDGILLEATGSATIELSFEGAQPAISGSWKGTLRLRAPSAPDQVMLNGELHPATREGDYLMLGELAPTVPGSPIRILKSRIQSGEDDAEERSSGTVDLYTEWLNLGDDQNRLVGLRFTDVQLPTDAVILEAHVQFAPRWEETGNTNLTLSGEASADSAAFGSGDHNLSTRTRTTAEVTWSNVPPWTQRAVANLDARSPDVIPIISEILGNPDWAAGNALTVFVEGSGIRVAQSFESDPFWVAKLVVSWGEAELLPESCLP